MSGKPKPISSSPVPTHGTSAAEPAKNQAPTDDKPVRDSYDQDSTSNIGVNNKPGEPASGATRNESVE